MSEPHNETPLCQENGCPVHSEPIVHRVELLICDGCLDGLGGQCNMPGCALIRSEGPCGGIREQVTVIPQEEVFPREAAMELLATWRDYIDLWNVRHEIEGCPEDDTCECPLVARINAAILKAEGK